MDKVKQKARRIGTALVGSVVLLVGIVAIPYPGPGWLIVFAGLAVLATEFTWAQRLLEKSRQYYALWDTWLRRQNILVRGIVMAITIIIVIVTLWLLNTFGVVDDILKWNMKGIHSPLGLFK